MIGGIAMLSRHDDNVLRGTLPQEKFTDTAPDG